MRFPSRFSYISLFAVFRLGLRKRLHTRARAHVNKARGRNVRDIGKVIIRHTVRLRNTFGPRYSERYLANGEGVSGRGAF